MSSRILARTTKTTPPPCPGGSRYLDTPPQSVLDGFNKGLLLEAVIPLSFFMSIFSGQVALCFERYQGKFSKVRTAAGCRWQQAAAGLPGQTAIDEFSP